MHKHCADLTWPYFVGLHLLLQAIVNALTVAGLLNVSNVLQNSRGHPDIVRLTWAAIFWWPCWACCTSNWLTFPSHSVACSLPPLPHCQFPGLPPYLVPCQLPISTPVWPSALLPGWPIIWSALSCSVTALVLMPMLTNACSIWSHTREAAQDGPCWETLLTMLHVERNVGQQMHMSACTHHLQFKPKHLHVGLSNRCAFSDDSSLSVGCRYQGTRSSFRDALWWTNFFLSYIHVVRNLFTKNIRLQAHSIGRPWKSPKQSGDSNWKASVGHWTAGYGVDRIRRGLSRRWYDDRLRSCRQTVASASRSKWNVLPSEQLSYLSRQACEAFVAYLNKICIWLAHYQAHMSGCQIGHGTCQHMMFRDMLALSRYKNPWSSLILISCCFYHAVATENVHWSLQKKTWFKGSMAIMGPTWEEGTFPE